MTDKAPKDDNPSCGVHDDNWQRVFSIGKNKLWRLSSNSSVVTKVPPMPVKRNREEDPARWEMNKRSFLDSGAGKMSGNNNGQ